MANSQRIWLPALVLLTFAFGFWVGRDSGTPVQARFTYLPNPFYIQGDPELQPFPGPGELPLPGMGQIPEECVLLFQDGQLYRMMPGEEGFPGQGNGSPELLPLEPVPNVPGLPIPQRSPPQGLDS
jgi:hypothetical protein